MTEKAPLSATLALAAALALGGCSATGNGDLRPETGLMNLGVADVMQEGPRVGVVFTGETARMREGLKLYLDGKVDYLLISGFNINWNATRLVERLGMGVPAGKSLDHIVFERDLGLATAANTEENAANTAAWIARMRASSVTLITADYHMDRSTYNLEQAMQMVDYRLPVRRHSVDVGASILTRLGETAKLGAAYIGIRQSAGHQSSTF